MRPYPYPHLNKGEEELTAPNEEVREHPIFSGIYPVGMITAQNPNTKAPPPAPGGNKALEKDLQDLGLHYEGPTPGRYGVSEDSYIVHKPTRQQLFTLGRKYSQESVVYCHGPQREMIYTTGEKVGKQNPGTGKHQYWTTEEAPPADYYTKIPGKGYLCLGFDFNTLHDSGFQATPTSQPEIQKAEIVSLLLETLKKSLGARLTHPHSYDWHNSKTHHHPMATAPGGVAWGHRNHHRKTGPNSRISLGKDEPATIDTSNHHYMHAVQPYGNTGEPKELDFYPYEGMQPQADKLVADHGYQPVYYGGRYGKPHFGHENYDTKCLPVYEPSDPKVDTYRKIHELAHALTEPEVDQVYGDGKRLGKLGPHLSMREAERAIHWEYLACHKQRKLSSSIGVNISDQDFNKELNTVMHEAVNRTITNKVTDPVSVGFRPYDHTVPLETALGIIRNAAGNLNGVEKTEPRSLPVADKELELSAIRPLLAETLKKAVTEYEDFLIELSKKEEVGKCTCGGKPCTCKGEKCVKCGKGDCKGLCKAGMGVGMGAGGGKINGAGAAPMPGTAPAMSKEEPPKSKFNFFGKNKKGKDFVEVDTKDGKKVNARVDDVSALNSEDRRQGTRKDEMTGMVKPADDGKFPPKKLKDVSDKDTGAGGQIEKKKLAKIAMGGPSSPKAPKGTLLPAPKVDAKMPKPVAGAAPKAPAAAQTVPSGSGANPTAKAEMKKSTIPMGASKGSVVPQNDPKAGHLRAKMLGTGIGVGPGLTPAGKALATNLAGSVERLNQVYKGSTSKPPVATPANPNLKA